MKKVEQGISIGPEGFREGNPNNFAALGTPEEIAELYRARGWSEEAGQALLSGKIIRRTTGSTPFGPDVRVTLSEDF